MSPNELPALTNWTNGIAVRAEHSNSVRLLCFHHAGGGASVFRSWVTELAPGIEVYPIQLPGREGRWLEPPLTRIPALISALSETLRPLLNPAFAFFGHSMGAFVAFELARQLRRENRPGPAVFIASAARAPQIPDPDPPLHALPRELLLEGLQRFDGIPAELLAHPDIVSLLLPTLRADLAMCETYAYSDEPPLDGPISVFGGEHDEKVSREDLAPWKAQSSGEFTLRMFPGKHFYFLKEGRLAVMQALRDALIPYSEKTASRIGVTPRAQLEQVIGRIWGELLGVPQVGLDDNFFDLGGNSLLMVRAYSTLREISATTLSVLDLFRYPTVRLLASAMAVERVHTAGPDLADRGPAGANRQQ